MTRILAIYAALISTVSLAISYLAYRSGGYRLKINTSLSPRIGDEPAQVIVRLTNTGRGPAVVSMINFDSPGPVRIIPDVGALDGPGLPYTIPGGNSGTWAVEADWLLTQTKRQMSPHRVRAIAIMADGKNLWESISQYTNLVSG